MPMSSPQKQKQLFQLLYAAAWIDGVIQPEERRYLHTMATHAQLERDRDIVALLTESKPIQPHQCFQMLAEYLGDRPSPEEYEQLISSISTLVYSDSHIDAAEAALLDQVQLFDPDRPGSHGLFQKFLRTVQTWYQEAVN